MERDDCAKLELNKILDACADFASLPGARDRILSSLPARDAEEARERLSFTSECHKLLFEYGSGKVEAFGDVLPLVDRAEKGSTLSMREIRDVCALLSSARAAHDGICGVKVDDAPVCMAYAKRLRCDERLEEDIRTKVIADDALADDASDELYEIRSKIKEVNEKIRSRLGEYVSGRDSEYLQESIVTMRGGRYVVPVKAEHKTHVKGFVHDRSASGATFFIEPEYVLELNNELVALQIDEKQEIEKILSRLTARVGRMAADLAEDVEILNTLEAGFAVADYSYSVKGVCPEVNGKGRTEIIRGRHPLIDKKKVVPVSVTLGDGYRFLILSGANTGGKTVTLKMCGLFSLMAACGIFVPADEGTKVAIFDSVFCDVGDAQSIEESLSTFSSHMTNIIDICRKATKNSLVLLDEPGGGTNPDEGQAIARAVLERLAKLGCEGIITTHFTPLKEFAYTAEGVENASMEFDSATLQPLYKMKIGLPGASNALAICRRLGMDEGILRSAEGYLSEGARSYENIMKRAEDAEVEAKKTLEEAQKKKHELDAAVMEQRQISDSLKREKEKITRGAKSESKRIIAERTEDAERMVREIEEIFAKDEKTHEDLIRARTLKNKLVKNPVPEEKEEETELTEKFVPATAETIRVGQRVYVPSAGCEADVISVYFPKGETEVAIGSVRYRCKIGDVGIVREVEEKKSRANFVRSGKETPPRLETNVIGMNVEEALSEVDALIDEAVLANLEEIKVIHGVGKGILRSAIGRHLQKNRHVASYRLGRYGEGESGVTFIKLKK